MPSGNAGPAIQRKHPSCNPGPMQVSRAIPRGLSHAVFADA